MSHFEPKEPFDGYDPNTEYPEMMDFCIRVESLQAAALGKWLYEKFSPKNVIDVGCGPGIYLLPFVEVGCKVLGIDACPTGGSVLKSQSFKRVDLRFPYKPKSRYDIAICFEVAEHMERHWSERLVDTLSDCADIIVFSAATPGQGGTYHINEQPHAFWLDMFKERHGYVVHPCQTEFRKFLEQFRPQEATGEVSGWLLNNSFILMRSGE
jgi:SAM-dependent methyltransferase